MVKTLIRCIVFSLIVQQTTVAQVLSSLRVNRYAVNDTILLDTLRVNPYSVEVEGVSVEDYVVLQGVSQLVWVNLPPKDSVEIQYRIMHFDLYQTYQHKSSKLIQQSGYGEINPFKLDGRGGGKYDYLSSGLTKNGSISRGISVGNNQDLSVNSNFNLQLSGKVTDRVNVLAAITDDNIPIQPEGNTQQLQEFDKVYIQLFDENNRLTAGDFQLQNRVPYFLKYNKKAKGGASNHHLLTQSLR